MLKEKQSNIPSMAFEYSEYDFDLYLETVTKNAGAP